MWRGAISFGMVAIPVRMYLATESKSVSFRMLCPSCGRPIRQKRWCPHEDREIGWTETARGYEVAKDEYVQVDDADLERLPLSTTKAVEILEFVDDKEIDAGVYIKSAYYLEPEAVGAKPYALLRRALESTGRVAIGRIALRDREHLCRLAIHENGLLLNTLHWPDEIRNTAELSIPEGDAGVGKRELDMAVMLVENLSATFDPRRHLDEDREALLVVVNAKLANRPIERPVAAEPAKVTDLMAALKASVEAAQDKRKGTAKAARTERSRKPPAEAEQEPARRRRAS